MTDAEFIGSVRELRRLVATFDALGYSINTICVEEEIKQLLPDKLQDDIINVAGSIHEFLQSIELSKRYKDVNKNSISKG